MEGYLFGQPPAQAAFVKAAELAHAAGRKVAITLSDGFCVERHRAAFRHLVEHHTDILFANESEILALYEPESFDAAAAAVRGHCEVACLTRSEKRSEEHTSELQSLMRTSYAVFCWKKNIIHHRHRMPRSC